MRHDLNNQWDLDKNQIAIDAIPSFSNKKFWWICDKGHEWQEALSVRKVAGTGCPFCANKRACHDNCLLTCFPDVAAEWHPVKNKDLKPIDVVYGSHKKVWWMCDKGHEWEAAVVKRTAQNRGCPFCKNQRACHDNCLLTCFPDVAAEWHPVKNKDLKPTDVVYGSCKKVWWLCNCGFSWEAMPRKRTQQNTGCPLCRASKGETAISAWLKREEIEFKSQYKFDGCKNRLKLPFDFYLPQIQKCIEFQGEQHYKPIPYFGGQAKLVKIQNRDKIKQEFCKQSNIDLLIVPYWKLAGIRNILKEFVYGK